MFKYPFGALSTTVSDFAGTVEKYRGPFSQWFALSAHTCHAMGLTISYTSALDTLLGPPLSVMLHFGEPILTGFETTTMECTTVGGEPVEAINLTLWRNGELLAHVNGSHLSHMTTPYQYGAYRCSVDSIHETAILMERGERVYN